MEYTNTTFSTEIKITCGCGSHHSATISHDQLSISEIDLALHKLRCWLVDEAQWVRTNGKIMCGRCYTMFDKKDVVIKRTFGEKK